MLKPTAGMVTASSPGFEWICVRDVEDATSSRTMSSESAGMLTLHEPAVLAGRDVDCDLARGVDVDQLEAAHVEDVRPDLHPLAVDRLHAHGDFGLRDDVDAELGTFFGVLDEATRERDVRGEDAVGVNECLGQQRCARPTPVCPGAILPSLPGRRRRSVRSCSSVPLTVASSVKADWRPVGLVLEFGGANGDVERRQHPPLRRDGDPALIAVEGDELASDRIAAQEDEIAGSGWLAAACGWAAARPGRPSRKTQVQCTRYLKRRTSTIVSGLHSR